MPRQTTDLYKRNLALLQARCPGIFPTTGSLPGSGSFTLLRSGDETPHLVAHPETGQPVAIHALDFAEQIEKVVRDGPIEDESLIFSVGFGFGYEARELISRRPRARLIIFEPLAELFQAALAHIDLSPLIGNPNVAFHIGSSIDPAAVLKAEDDALRALPVHFIAHSILCERFPESYKPLADDLQRRLLHIKGGIGALEGNGPLFFQNILRNVPCLTESAHVAALEGRCPGVPAVCVAAGPSLTKNVEQLKGHEDKIFIIAVDSAAKVLLDHGVTPHLLVTIDPIPAGYQKLQPVMDAFAGIPLLWAAESFPGTIVSFPKTLKFVGPDMNELFRTCFSPLFDKSVSFPHVPSVMHAAIQTAALAGCDPIVFIGLDLALSGGKDHADGCPIRWKKTGLKTMVPGWGGGEVETVPVLRNQLIALEAFLGRQNGRFIDATEGGARIEGAEIMPLGDALAQYADKQAHGAQALQTAWQEGKKPVSQELAKALQMLRQQLLDSGGPARIGLKEGLEAQRLWKWAARNSRKKDQHLRKFKESLLRSAQAVNDLLQMARIINILYPLRAREHHQLMYARKKNRETQGQLSSEERISAALSFNIDYCSSWLESVTEANRIIEPVLAEMNGKAEGKR